MRVLLGFLLLCLGPSGAFAFGPDDIVGTWKLVSSTRKVLETGQENPTYGTHPTGWITYGRDGRMMVLIVNDHRPKPESVASMSDADRVQLFKTMLAYSGTYSIEGNTITHSIDTSWNEIWSGTKTVREVEMRGDLLIYRTKPAPASMDGKMSVVTLIWEKVK